MLADLNSPSMKDAKLARLVRDFLSYEFAKDLRYLARR